SDEVDYWVGVLARKEQTAAQIAFGFAASAERETLRIQDAYMHLLGRAAQSEEVSTWLQGFLRFGLTREELAAELVGSKEYFDGPSNGRGDAGFWVQAVYVDIFQRFASDAEIAYW